MTVTLWAFDVPGHPLNEVVMEKFTVCGATLRFQIDIWGMGDPVPGAMGHGFMFPAGQLADHEKSVPATVEFRMTAAVSVPEQMDWLSALEMTGFGFT